METVEPALSGDDVPLAFIDLVARSPWYSATSLAVLHSDLRYLVEVLSKVAARPASRPASVCHPQQLAQSAA